jgi:hypothetical protein
VYGRMNVLLTAGYVSAVLGWKWTVEAAGRVLL